MGPTPGHRQGALTTRSSWTQLFAIASLLLLFRGVSATAPKTCLERTGVTLLYPDSPDYNTTAQSQNTNYHYHPAIIAEPKSTKEVQALVKCAALSKGAQKVSTFGGGHGYAAYGLGGANGFFVIDSKNMEDLHIDASSSTVTVGMGITLGPLALAIGKQGYGLPHGTCTSIGIGGHSLGGGWGYSSRQWGWLMDHIVKMTLVTPAGAIKQLSPSSRGSDADLWWSLRGAGANNFGVVTSFTLKMQQAPAKAVNYKTTFDTSDECASALVAFQELGRKTVGAGGLPAALGAQLLMYGEGTPGEKGACSFAGQYLGPLEDFKKVEMTLMTGFKAHGVQPEPINATEFTGWVETLTNLEGNLTVPSNDVPYYAQSLMDDGSPGYTKQSALAIMKALQKAVNVSTTSTSASFDLDGPVSRTNAVQPYGDSAFAVSGQRKSLFLSQIYNYGTPGFDKPQAREKVLKLVDGVTNAIRAAKPNGDWRVYTNYVDPRLKDWPVETYGAALPRLKQIKKAVDPQTIFDYPQGLAHA